MCNFYLELFEHKTFGIFQLLDDECKMKQPSLKNFMFSVNSRHMITKFPALLPNRPKTEQNCFMIRHFTRDVHYTTVSILKF